MELQRLKWCYGHFWPKLWCTSPVGYSHRKHPTVRRKAPNSRTETRWAACRVRLCEPHFLPTSVSAVTPYWGKNAWWTAPSMASRLKPYGMQDDKFASSVKYEGRSTSQRWKSMTRRSFLALDLWWGGQSTRQTYFSKHGWKWSSSWRPPTAWKTEIILGRESLCSGKEETPRRSSLESAARGWPGSHKSASMESTVALWLPVGRDTESQRESIWEHKDMTRTQTTCYTEPGTSSDDEEEDWRCIAGWSQEE